MTLPTKPNHHGVINYDDNNDNNNNNDADVTAGVDVVYNGPAGSMLSFIIHSLLLLPVRFVRPLLHDLLSLLPYLDKLNALLPAAKLLETEELSWSVGDGTYPTVLMYRKGLTREEDNGICSSMYKSYWRRIIIIIIIM